MKDTTYNVILDQYGYMIGIEQNEDADEYLFLTGIDNNYSNLYTKTSDASVIFTDGTMKAIKVDNKDSELGTISIPAQANMWCTYTVDKDGVYTLTKVEATNVAGKDAYQAAQDADNATGDTVTIDKKHISLSAIDGKKAYGNDESIYINVTLKNLKTAATVDNNEFKFRVIDDVDSVVTGIKNVKITVTDVKNDGKYVAPEKEIYTLYNDDNWVIAAVVIGEDDGISTNYAYITSTKPNRESYDSAADEWTWTREAIVNGKVVELTEVGSKLKYLAEDKMKSDNWYEIKYDANGNVRGYNELDFKNSANKYINSVSVVEDSVDAHDTVLLATPKTANDQTVLTYDKGSLYTAVDKTKGFAVSPDVKVVLCLANDKGEMFDEISEYSGYDGLEKAIRNLNNKNDPFVGTLSALFENGVATSIVINDKAAAAAVDTGKDTTSGNIKTVNLALSGDNANLWLNLLDKNGNKVENGEYSYTLYMRTASQDAFNVAETGTLTAASVKDAAFKTNVPAGYSWYIVVDGLTSNTLTKLA